MGTFSCCICGDVCYEELPVITQFGVSPNLCAACLPEITDVINPPRGLLVRREDALAITRDNNHE